MLLAIDVGNTQTHIGAFDGAELIEHWRIGTEAEATADELAIRVSSVLELRGLALDGIDGSIVSSVVPPLTPEYGRMAERYLAARHLSVVPGIKTGIVIRMDNPRELGADRLVNAVAAYGPLWRALRRGRLRYRDHLRRDLGSGRVPRRGDRARAFGSRWRR